MKRFSYAAIGLLLVLVFIQLQLGAADPGISLSVPLTGGFTANLVLGIDLRQNGFTPVQAGDTITYSNGVYRIDVTNSENLARNIVHVHVARIDGAAFSMSGFSIAVTVPRSLIQGIWYPSAAPSAENIMVADANHSIDDVADANYGIPYVSAASSDSRNAVAIGFGRQDLSVSIVGKPVENTFYELRVKALRPRTQTAFDEYFFVSTNPSMNWFDTAGSYADWVDELNGYEPFPISDRAYEPLYDAWYWAGDRVNERVYSQTAELAAQAGFGSYLADAGWDAATGEYEKWLKGSTGDYAPPADKFRDLPGTFDKIRTTDKLGINLWLQPFAVGRTSRRYAETRNMHIHVPKDYDLSLGWTGLAYSPFALPLGSNLETVNLCPSTTSTQTYLKNLFNEMAAKYKPEGYWIDFMDGMATYCVAPHTHTQGGFGAGFRGTLSAIKTAILSTNPNAVVQFRAKYANLNNKSFANVYQTGDSPGDFDGMRLGSIRLRPFSKGVAFATDQMYWPDATDEASVSKFIATSVMVGIPAFGPTLINSPQSTLAMLKAWLAFYREHTLDLTRGRFSIFGSLGVPNHKIEGGSAFVYVRNLEFSELQVEGKAIFIVNATDEDRFNRPVRVPPDTRVYSVKVLDRFLVPERREMTVIADRSGVLDLNIAVEQGGMIVLTPRTRPAGR